MFFRRFMRDRRSLKGFTLIDTLMAIAIIVILLGAVFYLLDPIKQINKFRNARRLRDVQAIASAVNLYYQDYGAWPEIPETWTMIGSETANCSAACGTGHGLRLVNSPGRIVVPGAPFNFAKTDDFSISAWIKPDPSPTSGTSLRVSMLMYKANTQGSLYGYAIGVLYSCSQGSCTEYAFMAITTQNQEFMMNLRRINSDEFSHVVFAYQGGQIFMHLNGQPGWDLFLGQTNPLTDSFQNNVDLLIGGSSSVALNGTQTNPFLGVVDDIRFFDRMLTDDEVRTLYEGRDTTILPIAHWSFDEGIGETVHDITENNNDGTFVDFQDENWEINTPGDFAAGGGRTASVCISLADELSEYLATVPNDPLEEESALTGYAIKKNGSIVSVVSCHSDGEGRGGEEPYPLIEVSL